MKVFSLMLILLLGLLNAENADAEKPGYDSYQIAIDGKGLVHKSAGTGVSKAATDTFYIYGGPGTVEGRFQTSLAGAGGAPDAQGWVGVDLTQQTPYWRGSTTNASSTADGNPKGFTGGLNNHAAISHSDNTVYSGYGNNWDDWLVFSYDVLAGDPGFDPGTDVTTVRYTCEYKHFTEELYDFLNFEWNQGGAYRTLIAIDSFSYNDSTGFYEILDFDSDGFGGITYNPGDYVETSKIQLRIRVTSDGGWSDEDGLFTTAGRGAAAVDNVTVYVNGATVSVADFELLAPKVDLGSGDFTGLDVGAASGTDGWTPIPSTFVGDFASIWGKFQDIDPCRDNVTPQFGFINYGSSCPNWPCVGCSLPPSYSSTWTYGIPGGYVVEYNGGCSHISAGIANEIWSPAINWDLPGPDDDLTNGGAVLGHTRWSHMPLPNGIFAVWHVRSRASGGDWSAWEDNNFVYYSPTGVYENHQIDVTQMLVQNPDQVQLAFGVVDLSGAFDFGGNDATPAPLYDNVYLKKYVIGGPVISTRTIDLASDCFPIDGTKTGSCRFDANIDTNRDVLVPGDSIVASIRSIIPGSSLAEPQRGGDLLVAQLANPDFSMERAAALAGVGALEAETDPQTGWSVYTYRILGQQVTNSSGEPVEDRYFWDLPDGTSNGLPHIPDEDPIFFPGDVIHYYLVAADDLGNVTTLPEDLSRFEDFTEGTSWSRKMTVRGLPSLQDGTQPTVMFWNDFGHRGGENAYLQAFRQNGLIEGVDYDTYTTKGPSSGAGNGLGSAGFHGANASQLDGYHYMIYVLGNLSTITISDGTGQGDNDFSADLQTMSDWANADADRFHAYFGDDFAESMVRQGTACQTYLNTVLGVDLLSIDVGLEIDLQTAATLVPTGWGSSAFVESFVAYGGCLLINDFDEIGAFGVGPTLTHEFTDSSGDPYPAKVAGSVEWRRLDANENIKHTIVVPYDLQFVRDPLGDMGSGISARARLLGEVFASWGKNVGGPPIGVDDPTTPSVRHEFRVEQNHPNPFNPSTRIAFSLPQRSEVRIILYNVRGEKIAVLLDEIRESGPSFVDWSGRDDRGAEVASGIYLYKVEAAGQVEIKKMVLIR